MSQQTVTAGLPSAIGSIGEIRIKLNNGKPMLFLDYDGTLTPIVSEPHKAKLSPEMYEILKQLAAKMKVSVISGRDLRDVKSKVGLNNIYYAGSHGFDIEGPAGLKNIPENVEGLLPRFDEAQNQLRAQLSAIPKIFIERKKFAIAVHYRNVGQQHVQQIIDESTRIADSIEGLKPTGGKMIVEIKPDMDWHKGRAVEWLLNILKKDDNASIPLFIGDDITDEDAFRTMQQNNGVGILVGNHGQPTAATFRLGDVEEVKAFLELLETM